MPRLFRESPLSSIWEGSGNVAALDTLRAIAKTPQSLAALFEEFAAAGGQHRAFDQAVVALKDRFAGSVAPEELEFNARRVVGDLSVVLQAALLIQHAPDAVSDAYVQGRLGERAPTVYGTLPTGIDTRVIIERATPRL